MQSHREILLVTRQDETEVDGVIDGLRRVGVDVKRWNLCQFPHASRFSLPANLSDESPSVGWYHSCGPLGNLSRQLVGLEREIALLESHASLDGFLLTQDVAWLNRPSAVSAASNKIYQLAVAADNGLPVPQYLVTNDVGRFDDFVECGATVVKPLATSYLEYGDETLRAFTRCLEPILESVRSSLALTPVFLQRRIARRAECRVTVVDDSAFSVTVDMTGLPEDVSDIKLLDFGRERWRFSSAGLRALETWSKQIVSALGLSYGGVDWIIDDAGDAFFLECNPLGAFKWYEITSGHPITEALVSALLSRLENST